MELSLAYRPGDSGIHRLNPLVMLAWLGVVVAVALVVSHPVWLLGALLVTFVVAHAARVVRNWLSVMRLVLWMAVAIVIINALVSQDGSHVLWQAGFRLPLLGRPALTLEALAFGAAMAVRLATIVSAFTLVNLCVHPDDLMRAAIKLRLPYRSVLVTSLSVRFMPVLIEDARTIADVQQSRGLSFGAGGIVERVRNRGALVLPLLSNSLDRAVQVAEAMEARAYGAPVRRTFYRDTRLTAPDTGAVAVLGVAVAALLAWRAAGIGSYQYYPSLGAAAMPPGEWLAFGLLCAALLSVVVAAGLRRGADR